jgi:hypothetical protein
MVYGDAPLPPIYTVFGSISDVPVKFTDVIIGS